MDVNVTVEYIIIEVSQVRVLTDKLLNDKNNLGTDPKLDYAGYIIVNKTNKTLNWSPRFYSALGYAPNEIIPSFESLEEIMHPSDFIIINALLQESKENRSINLKLRYKTKSRTHIILNSSVRIISNKKLQLYNN